MNRRWICSDVWMDILPSFNRPQLGLKMALLSDRFDILVDAHFDGKTTELPILREIAIDEDRLRGVNYKGPTAKLSVIAFNSAEFPLPDRPLPNKIRFKKLRIKYIDYSVIEFLRSNKQIWDRSGTKLVLDVRSYHPTYVQQIWNAFVPEIWPIFATSIRHLGLLNADALDNLLRRTSPTFLTDLDQLNSIDSGAIFPDGIADFVGPNATAGQALAKWLHIPSKNGQAKRLCCFNAYGHPNLECVNDFKETFRRATTSVSYQIQLYFYVHPTPTEPFELVNEVTNEKLILKQSKERNDLLYNWLLKRYPIGETETAPIKFELRHVNYSGANLNNIRFDLCANTNRCIGPLSPPADEEEEADQSNGK